MTVGERIRKARKWAGYTQKQLADKLGLPYQRIGQYETGVRNPKDEMLRKIEDALGLPENDLKFDPDEINEYLQRNSDSEWETPVDEFGNQLFHSKDEYESATHELDSYTFSEKEKNLVSLFNSLTEEEQFAAIKLISGQEQQKEPAPEESRLTDDVMELVDNYDALNQEGKDILLNTSRGLVASGLYQEEPTTSAG